MGRMLSVGDRLMREMEKEREREAKKTRRDLERAARARERAREQEQMRQRREEERSVRQAERQAERLAEWGQKELLRAATRLQRERERSAAEQAKRAKAEQAEREKEARAEQAEREREAKAEEARRERQEAERAVAAYEAFHRGILALQGNPALVQSIEALKAAFAPQDPVAYDQIATALVPRLKPRPVELTEVDADPAVVRLRTALQASLVRERETAAACAALSVPPPPKAPAQPLRDFMPRTFSSELTATIAALEAQERFDLAAYAVSSGRRVAAGALAMMGDLLRQLGPTRALGESLLDGCVTGRDLRAFHLDVRDRLRQLRERLAQEQAGFEREERERAARADHAFAEASARFEREVLPAHRQAQDDWRAQRETLKRLEADRAAAADAARRAEALLLSEVRTRTDSRNRELRERRKDEVSEVRSRVHQELERQREAWTTRLRAGDVVAIEEALELVLPARFALDEDHVQSDPADFDVGYQVLAADHVAMLILLPRQATFLPDRELRLTPSGQQVSEARISAATQREAVRYVVAGTALAVARLGFEVLPSVTRIDVEVQEVAVDRGTGHLRDDTLLTATLSRESVQGLAFDTVDALAALRRLARNMKDPGGDEILTPLADRDRLLWAVTGEEHLPQPIGFLFHRAMREETGRDVAQVMEQLMAVFADVTITPKPDLGSAPRDGDAGSAGADPGCDVVLVDAGPRKIQVIKVLRDLTGLGLKEAKDVVDAPPQTIGSGLDEQEATRYKAELEAEGAQVEIRPRSASPL